MRRTFVVELDVPDNIANDAVLGNLYDCILAGQGIDHENVSIQSLQQNKAVFAGSNSVILMLPILDTPLPAICNMTVHTESFDNWLSPGISRVNALGYLCINDDIELPQDESLVGESLVRYKRLMTVDRSTARFLTQCCRKPPGKKNCFGKDVPLFDREVLFDNSMRMAIQVCPSVDPDTEECWTQGVLYDKDGNECGCTDVGDSFLGEYCIWCDGVEYVVDVVDVVAHW